MRARGCTGAAALTLILLAQAATGQGVGPPGPAPAAVPGTVVQAGQGAAVTGGSTGPGVAAGGAMPPDTPPLVDQAGNGNGMAEPWGITRPAFASVVLTIDQNALYSESRWGKRMRTSLEARSRELQAENDRIAASLEQQDDALTALRPTLTPDEFRLRADAFDTKVQQVRQERDRAGSALLAEAEADRTAFLEAVLPVLGAMMNERGAVAILDRRAVFLSADSVDVTRPMIERVDEALGDGPARGAPAGAPAEDSSESPAGNGPAGTPTDTGAEGSGAARTGTQGSEAVSTPGNGTPGPNTPGSDTAAGGASAQPGAPSATPPPPAAPPAVVVGQ